MKKCLYALFRLDTLRQKLLLLLGILTIGVFNTLSAQTVYRYTGTVSDAGGVTLPGVNVIEEGTTNGTTTDVNGFFILESIAPKAMLNFSFVGYMPQKIEATPGTSLKIILEESVVALKEVMVVGYGTQKKSYITGAISKIDSKGLKSIPSARVDQAIQGRIAGVSVLPNSGSPGASLKVRIRGTSTNGNSDPLYIVDGMKSGDISNIEPSDIESIEVLKDGASAAIYGAEAANGVILITTKSGKSGVGKINYDFQYGIQTPGKLVDVMNAKDWTTWVNEANVGVTIPANPAYNTNWLEEETSTAPM